MAYQVLARKWRPHNFEEMVGQEHVLRALINALDNDRLHHAYLFTGTRGVGKTTVARIFAKSLNCETGITSKPCGECSACREIDAGHFVDLIEVDAASRTGVDDTRELLENVQYTPTQGRFKVYLIDEVHMFSTHSFNALLKTLEEPPPHVKFLLATTDPQKLPVTILSRCLQFNLKRLSGEAIRDYLAKVLEEEGIEQELPALTLIARGADGSMRDGLSLLDQAIAFGGGRVVEAEVQAMLGTIGRDHVFGVIEDLADNDGAALMKRVAEQAEMGADFSAWLADLLTALQRIALVQQVPDVIEDSLADPQRIRDLAARISPEDAQLFYQIGLMGRRDLPLSPEPRGGFEMVLLRMLAFRPASGAGAAHSGGGQTQVAASVAPGRVSSGELPGGRGGVTAQVSGGRESATLGSESERSAGAVSDPGPCSGDDSIAFKAGVRTGQSPLAGARVALGDKRATGRSTAASTAVPSAARESSSPTVNPPSGQGAMAADRTQVEPIVAVVPSQAAAMPDFPPEPPPGLDVEMAGPSGGALLPREALPGEPVQAPAPPAVETTKPMTKKVTEASASTPVSADSLAAPIATDTPVDWLTLMPRLRLEGVVQALASHCVQRPSDAGRLILALDPSKSGLLNNERVKRLQQAVDAAVSGPLRIEIAVAHSSDASPAIIAEQERVQRLRRAEQSIADDSMVRAMQERMGAMIQVDSVRPLN